MGWQIIKQPNGKYCIFSSVVDNVIYHDLSKEQTIGVFVRAEAERIQREVSRIIERLEKGEKPYGQFTHTFDEMILTIEDIHSKKEANKVVKLIG